jgi:hypothetical protein
MYNEPNGFCATYLIKQPEQLFFGRGVGGLAPNKKRRTKCDTIIAHYSLFIAHYKTRKQKRREPTNEVCNPIM